jgi:hypothetical protein
MYSETEKEREREMACIGMYTIGQSQRECWTDSAKKIKYFISIKMFYNLMEIILLDHFSFVNNVSGLSIMGNRLECLLLVLGSTILSG